MNIATTSSDDRHGDLSADEHRASPAPPAAGRDAVARLHHGGEIGARRLDRRHEAEDHGARDRDDEAEDAARADPSGTPA